jgi:hypothetical protein
VGQAPSRLELSVSDSRFLIDALPRLPSQQSAFAQPRGKILGVEEELRGRLVAGCPDLLARIDLLVETDDALVITDFKTARSR